MDKVYVAVFTSQDRQFDECGRGYLPLFHSVFGIYEDMWDAIMAVNNFLYSEHEEYEVLENCPCTDGYGKHIGQSYTFRYEDKSTGALGLYEIEIGEEHITPSLISQQNQLPLQKQ